MFGWSLVLFIFYRYNAGFYQFRTDGCSQMTCKNNGIEQNI